MNFDPRKNSSRKFSGLIEEDSTKSQRKSKARLMEEHQEYGYFSHSKQNKTRERKDSKRLDASMELCEELVKTV